MSLPTGNQLGFGAGTAFAEMLETNTTLRKLVFDHNPLSEDAGNELLSGTLPWLCRACAERVGLVCLHVNVLTTRARVPLAAAIERNADCNLRHLSLVDTGQDETFGQSLFELLASGVISLTSVNVQENHIGEGATNSLRQLQEERAEYSILL